MALLTNINGKFSVSDAGAVTFNNAFTFPTADGTANYVLKTNGSGQLAWGPDNDGGDITGSGTANTVTKFTGAKTIGDGPITFSSNDSTFAGNVSAGGGTFTQAGGGVQVLNNGTAGYNANIFFGKSDGTDGYSIGQGVTANDGVFRVYNNGTASVPLAIADNNDATFAGEVSLKSRLNLQRLSGGSNNFNTI